MLTRDVTGAADDARCSLAAPPRLCPARYHRLIRRVQHRRRYRDLRLRRHPLGRGSGKFLVQIDKAVPAGVGVHLVRAGGGSTATRAVHGTPPGRVAGSPSVRAAMG
jgi:hypothetical protein